MPIDNVREHIREMGEECVDVILQQQHTKTNFNSFKIIVLSDKVPKFLSTDFWPKGIKYRRFRERSANVEIKHN